MFTPDGLEPLFAPRPVSAKLRELEEKYIAPPVIPGEDGYVEGASQDALRPPREGEDHYCNVVPADTNRAR